MSNKNDNKFTGNILISFFFCLILLLFLFCNIKNLYTVFKQKIREGNNPKETLSNIEESFQENFYGKSTFANLYGITLNGLNWKIIGDYEFIKDEAGIMQRISSVSSYENYIASISSLLDRLKESNTICVDVNLPDRGSLFSVSEDIIYSGKRYDDLESQLVTRGLKEFNVQESAFVNDMTQGRRLDAEEDWTNLGNA